MEISIRDEVHYPGTVSVLQAANRDPTRMSLAQEAGQTSQENGLLHRIGGCFSGLQALSPASGKSLPQNLHAAQVPLIHRHHQAPQRKHFGTWKRHRGPDPAGEKASEVMWEAC